MSDVGELDERIQYYYGKVFDEETRLTTRSAQGPVEFRRVQELIAGLVPDGSRVLDVGGGSGHHAVALAARGCDVTLVDVIPGHVRAARARGLAATLADARALPFDDDAFDAVLLLGPLYHLGAVDRCRALSEAVRVTRRGGHVAAAGLSRLAAYLAATQGNPPAAPLARQLADLLTAGMPMPHLRFPAAHFHSADELAAELAVAGVVDVRVAGIEGPAGLFLESRSTADDDLQEAALVLARASSGHPATRDLSAHLLAVGAVP